MATNPNAELQLRQMEYEMTPAGQQQRQLDILARQSAMYAASTIIPDTYRNNPGNCGIAIDMAQRMGCNPLMVMQNLYIVHGQPSFSSKFLIAALNSTGRFSPLSYEWTGEEGKPSWGCRATAVRLSDGEVLKGSKITLDMATKEGWATKKDSKWQSMPEQMLMYRAAAFFQRAYAPEVSMGFISTEEAEEQMVKTEDTTYVEVSGDNNVDRAREALNHPAGNASPAPSTTKDSSGLSDEEKAAIEAMERE